MKKILILFFIPLLLTACNHRNPAKTLREAENLLQQHPDSALMLLNDIEWTELDDSIQAQYLLLRARTHAATGQAMVDDTVVLHALDYYRNRQPRQTNRLFEAYDISAQALWWAEDKKRASELLQEGIRTAENEADTASIIRLLRTQNSLRDYDTQVVSDIKRLIELDRNSPDRIEYYDLLATTYFRHGEKDSAINVFENIGRYCLTSNDSLIYWDYALRDYADMLSEYGYNRKAIDLQKKALEHYKRYNHENLSLSYSSLARYCLNIGQNDSARHYMNLAIETKPVYFDRDITLSTYYQFLQKAIDFSESRQLNLADNILMLNKVRDDYFRNILRNNANEKNALLLKQKNLSLTVSRQRQQLWMISIIFLLTLALTAIAIYSVKRKRKMVEKEEEIETLMKLFKESREATDTDQSFVKKTMLQQLGIIRLIAANPSAANQELLKQMTDIANRKVDVDTLIDWEHLYKTIDYLYGNFHTLLKKQYGETLNEKEIQLCCLLKADFSTKEIAIVTQQSLQTIYQRKSVIRQKLDMPEKEDIADFISQSFA